MIIGGDGLAAGGAGDSTNVSHAFHPSGLLAFSAGQYPTRSGAFYFVNIGLVGACGGAAAGERLKVSQRFQPAARFSLANSP